MAKIIWSPKAINELGRICDYIGENSEYYARLFAENSLDNTLCTFAIPRFGLNKIPECYAKRDREVHLRSWSLQRWDFNY
ncbi:MAG: hypothetical protein IMF19_11025 [Proteobacteria bacterium]|nr:hypothetical protein [Pseudomonadota bacterium]